MLCCVNLQHVWIYYPPKHILVHISADNALILLKFGFLVKTPKLIPLYILNSLTLEDARDGPGALGT